MMDNIGHAVPTTKADTCLELCKSIEVVLGETLDNLCNLSGEGRRDEPTNPTPDGVIPKLQYELGTINTLALNIRQQSAQIASLLEPTLRK